MDIKIEKRYPLVVGGKEPRLDAVIGIQVISLCGGGSDGGRHVFTSEE